MKGRAGSPYAITDYYDVNPYLADKPERRMEEFTDLVKRVHEAGLKVIIDFVPNHVARDYAAFTASHPAPTGMPALGADDDKSVHWKEEMTFSIILEPSLSFRLNHSLTKSCLHLPQVMLTLRNRT